MNKYVAAESVMLIFSGENYFETLEKLIDSARETIHFQTYIFEEDETGTRIAEALVRAAKRNIDIFLLLDGYGSNSLSGKFVQHLRNAGISFRFFSPWFSSESLYFGRRLHHKIIVADKMVALVGGINIADKYRGRKDEPPWMDYAVLVRGEACSYLHKICENIFNKKLFQRNPKFTSLQTTGDVLIRFRRNDWTWNKNEIILSYLRALSEARHSVIIIASYFLPGFFFRKILKRTRKRGVEISIILTGKSDVHFIRSAERYLYGYLLRHGIRIYEWPNSIMHGKVALVDYDWATIGSFNINQLSLYRSIELNVDIKSKNFVQSFRNHLEKIISEECNEITREKFYGAGVFSQLLYFFSFQYVRIIQNIFFRENGRKKRRDKKFT